jgi:predicted lipoprotein with Yx(FWY)xxD motif
MKAPLLLALPIAALVACGSTSSTSNSSTGGAAATPGSSTSSTSSAAAGVAVSTGTAGSAGTVLVDAQMHTLYRFMPEANGSIACTGTCQSTWPPLTVAGGQQVQPSGSLSGKFATVARPDGTMQVTYNGWPLYRYGGDTSAGTAKGQGIGGKWFAVTPDQAAAGM